MYDVIVVGARCAGHDIGDVKGDIEANYLKTLEDWAPSLASRAHGGNREAGDRARKPSHGLLQFGI